MVGTVFIERMTVNMYFYSNFLLIKYKFLFNVVFY
uniref:Uncharacterized protein n=1 Tax=Emiliania huxleyi TaxID=2903 RepID=Q4G3D1_EMIHU|nr:hypothetical protein EmhuCp028 [Emiliania huxleyi]AAX13835.1 unknown [Emiliania huxleyi]